MFSCSQSLLCWLCLVFSQGEPGDPGHRGAPGMPGPRVWLSPLFYLCLQLGLCGCMSDLPLLDVSLEASKEAQRQLEKSKLAGSADPWGSVVMPRVWSQQNQGHLLGKGACGWSGSARETQCIGEASRNRADLGKRHHIYWRVCPAKGWAREQGHFASSFSSSPHFYLSSLSFPSHGLWCLVPFINSVSETSSWGSLQVHRPLGFQQTEQSETGVVKQATQPVIDRMLPWKSTTQCLVPIAFSLCLGSSLWTSVVGCRILLPKALSSKSQHR